MLCVAAFVVLLVLGIFSARYRGYLRSAWRCTLRRVTFRPCDTTFGQGVRDRMLAPVAAWRPGLVRPAAVGIEIVALLVVATTLLSGYAVAKGAINLAVYGTCDKADPAGCSLGAEACSIGDLTPSFLDSVTRLDLAGAVGNELADVAGTLGAIPDRWRRWDATEYLPPNATWRTGFDPARPTALEVIDPGCSVCAELARNMREAGFAERYNVSYIAYPIPDPLGSRFANSMLVVRYLEALRLREAAIADAAIADAAVPLDWLVLERLLLDVDPTGRPWREVMNEASASEAVAMLHDWLAAAGLDAAAIEAVAADAVSERVAAIIEGNMTLVRERIGTVKIPTLLFDGGRHDGLVGLDALD